MTPDRIPAPDLFQRLQRLLQADELLDDCGEFGFEAQQIADISKALDLAAFDWRSRVPEADRIRVARIRASL